MAAGARASRIGRRRREDARAVLLVHVDRAEAESRCFSLAPPVDFGAGPALLALKLTRVSRAVSCSVRAVLSMCPSRFPLHGAEAAGDSSRRATHRGTSPEWSISSRRGKRRVLMSCSTKRRLPLLLHSHEELPLYVVQCQPRDVLSILRAAHPWSSPAYRDAGGGDRARGIAAEAVETGTQPSHPCSTGAACLFSWILLKTFALSHLTAEACRRILWLVVELRVPYRLRWSRARIMRNRAIAPHRMFI